MSFARMLVKVCEDAGGHDQRRLVPLRKNALPHDRTTSPQG